jgi:hypothetical protein
MLDPVSALAIATSAFNLLKKGISAGRELEDMAGQLGTWFGAVSDVKSAEEEANDPPLFRKLISSGSVEQAMQALLARKKIEQQEKELRELIVWRWGVEEYTAMMRDRTRIKDTRAKAIQNQRRKMRKLIANVLTITAILGLVGAIVAFGIGIIINLGQ